MNRRHVISSAVSGRRCSPWAHAAALRRARRRPLPAHRRRRRRRLPQHPRRARTLKAETNAKLGKQIIVDAADKTVYMYVPDGTGTTSKVSTALKAAWPPVVTPGAVIVGSGLSATKLRTDRQSDGSQTPHASM